jgi:diguanylate cyclase (GGDEF)-like protein/PAS domain S-box-containing protein
MTDAGREKFDPPEQTDGCDEDATAISLSAGDESDRICPISGWSVQRRPAWTRVKFERGFSITAEIIGGRILLTHNRGRATLEGVRKAFDFTDAIIEEHFGSRPYIHILDYTHLGGTTLDGRRRFIRRMLKRRRQTGVIFYGLSPMLRMSTKLGKRLNMFPFDVHIAKDYPEAIAQAMALLNETDETASDSRLPKDNTLVHYRSRDGIQHTILRRAEWQLELDGFRIAFEIIDGRILHTVSEGFFRDTHLPKLIAMRDRVYRSLLEPQDPHYIIAGFQGLSRVGRRARKYYLDSISAWHRKMRLQGYIAYGLNPFMAAVANFSRFILPFPVHVAKDLDSALQITAMETKAARGNDAPRRKTSLISGHGARETTDPVEHLLEYIGSIDWERDGLSLSKAVKANGTFAPVYDAISVIKSELDDLLHEKLHAEKALETARDELDARVRERTAELIETNRRLQTEITERREMEGALRASEKNYRNLVDSVNSIILRWDAEGKIVFMNPYGLKFFGYEAEELIGENVVGSIVPESESISQRDLADLMHQIQEDPDRFRNNENENVVRDGRRVWIYWTNRAITDAEGRIVEILSVGNDITGRRHMEAELRRLATTDFLTGAFNRRRFFQKARQEFLRHQRYGHHFAVLLMDMDHFKKINDTHGHPAGDTVLKTFVDTCHNIFRVTDIFGRTGGEEFSAVLPETDAANAVRVAERLRDRVANTRVDVGTDNSPIRFTVSIGLTDLKEEDVTLESMIRRADKALYDAKRAGRNRVMQT